MSDQDQPTFVLLRYSLGGDRPSQTTHQALSASPIQGPALEHQTYKGGISRTAPAQLASRLQSLPPILHMQVQCSVPSCSKGSRGLSVQPRVHRIFTANSISLSLGWRQHGHGYTIRAGRNLPDKEFRYLRTVIVTAAVHRGFNSNLSILLLTFRHWAGVSPYTSPSSLAQTCVFGKQLLGTLHCDLFLLKVFILSHNIGTPSPEVTGPFCRVPQLELSCRPRVTHPVHLCRFTVRALHNLNRSFSRQYRICDLQPKLLTHKISCLNMWICLHVHTTSLERDNRRPSHIPSCVTPSLITFIQWYRNINLFSIRLRF